jgi:hypothetical protein
MAAVMAAVAKTSTSARVLTQFEALRSRLSIARSQQGILSGRITAMLTLKQRGVN